MPARRPKTYAKRKPSARPAVAWKNERSGPAPTSMLTWSGPPWARCCVWNARSIISSPSGPVLNASMVLLTNGASRLERKFSKRTLALIIWEKAVEQSGDNVEHGSQISAMRPEMLGYPLKEFLGMTHPGQHLKTRFDNHSLIPSALCTHVE